jgi:hypothetical protein
MQCDSDNIVIELQLSDISIRFFLGIQDDISSLEVTTHVTGIPTNLVAIIESQCNPPRIPRA